MATLALSRDMLADYARLQRPAQSRVRQLADQFRQMDVTALHKSKGIHLEPYEGQLDKRARTIRIDDNHRGIVLDAGNEDLFVLVRIGTHKEVDRWMVQHQFRVNEATGALEVVNTVAIENAVADSVQASDDDAAHEPTKLFDHRRDKDFRQLGINEALLPALRAFVSDDQLQAILDVLPPGQADALILLTGDDAVDRIYTEIAGATDPADVDANDVAAAVVTPASRGSFHVISDEDELQEMLARPLAQWRVYLHNSQHEAAYRSVYNGPARITGGAGTGKTVVALHRARYLASQLADRSGQHILFTTFTTNLAESIQRDLLLLGGADLLDVIEVTNIDRLANRTVAAAEGRQAGVATTEHLRDLWQDATDELVLSWSPEFVAAEFDQVVLAQQCRSRSDYFAASRAGRGVRLSRKDRAQLWKAVEAVTEELAMSSRRTFLQIADDAAGYLASRTVKPYQHVIVDEAQDLHEAQWRLVRASVAEGPNDLFLVGDSHQRIYDRRTSLSKVGINIVGRSRRLKINYRTTHEILRWALAFLGDGTYDDLDGGSETQELADYHSFLHGPAPRMGGFDSKREQLDALSIQIRTWLEAGVPEDEIAVAARTSGALDAAGHALKRAGIRNVTLGRDLPTADGVRLATMHRLKGVEFRCVAIIDVDDDQVPLSFALTDPSADAAQHEADLRRERCLAYVAATRARDDLWISWSGRPSRFLGPLHHSA